MPPGSAASVPRAPVGNAWWIDAVMAAALMAIIAGMVAMAREWAAPLRPAVVIDLSPAALPGYTLLSLARGFAAYGFSLVFTLIYGTVAAYSRRAERVMIPLLDILQGIPVLGFMPGLVLGMVALFPHSNTGLELACILMIFTGQVWNMTFSFYGSLRAVPQDLREVSRFYRFGWGQRFRTVETSYAAMGLVWNSMMSMAGGWFFLTVNEAFRMGDHDFRLPGIGSYMSEAIHRGDVPAMVWAVVAMAVMIVATDQLVWRPVVAWAQKFRMDDTGSGERVESWALDLVRRSALVRRLRGMTRDGHSGRFRPRTPASAAPDPDGAPLRARLAAMAGWLLAAFFGGLALWGAWKMAGLLSVLRSRDWAHVGAMLFLTFLRTSAAVAIAVAWTVPVGVWIGLSPRISRVLQPVIQVVASFPAPMLYPLLTAALLAASVSFSWGCIALMLLGAQWYVLFNVIAGAMAIPGDLREAADVYGMSGWERWRRLYLPGIFPNLVTGMITAAGGAWNASIVSEYVQYRGGNLVAPGIGSLITEATATGNFPLLAAGVFSMSVALVVINRFFWKRLYRLADTKYALNR